MTVGLFCLYSLTLKSNVMGGPTAYAPQPEEEVKDEVTAPEAGAPVTETTEVVEEVVADEPAAPEAEVSAE